MFLNKNKVLSPYINELGPTFVSRFTNTLMHVSQNLKVVYQSLHISCLKLPKTKLHLFIGRFYLKSNIKVTKLFFSVEETFIIFFLFISLE